MGRILEFIRYPSHSRTFGILAFLVVLLAIPLTVNIAQKQQELRQHAEGSCTCSHPGTTAAIDPRAGVVGCFTDPVNLTGYYGNANCTGTSPTLAPVVTQAPAPTQPPQTAAPAPTQPPAACDASQGFIGSCTVADQSRGAILNTIKGSCNRVCPAGTAKAGQTVQGISYMQCQSNTCWYDALYDSRQATSTRVLCYGDPSVPDPCNATPAPTATAAPTASAAPNSKPPCTKPSNPNANACTAPVNTCNVTSGTRVANLDLLDDGTSNCNPQTAQYYPCTAPAGISNCPAPNTCNSSQCVTPAGSAAPTATPAPTAAPAGSTTLAFTNIQLYGIGTNNNRVASIKPLTVQVIDATNNTKMTTIDNGSLIYDSSRGKWTGTASTTFPFASDHTYTFKLKTPNYINRAYRTPTSITAGQSNNLSDTVDRLPPGDIDVSGTVDISDVNILLSCWVYSTDSTLCSSNPNYKNLSDLNQDGRVDQYDYNLLLSEFGQSDQ